MNKFSDDDPQLTNFLRQHRSLAPPELPELENRLLSAIESLPPQPKRRNSHNWWRGLTVAIGTLGLGILGATIHQVMNPPQPSIAELHQLDRYLEAHFYAWGANPTEIEGRDPDSLDAYLLPDDDEPEDL